MANKPGKKESRSRTPPEKRKSKGFEQSSPAVPSELTDSSSNSVQKVDDIQALAIHLGDLEKLHLPRRPREEQRSPVTNRILIRKHQEKEEGPKRRLLVARLAPRDSESRGQIFPGGIPLSSPHGHIQPHNILGSLQELRREAYARGNKQIAQIIPDVTHPGLRSLGAHDEKGGLEQKEMSRHPHRQDNALLHWQYHMQLRKRQLDALSRRLCKPSEQLVMNAGEDYRRIQEERGAIDCCISALESGKGYRTGSEFWNLSERIGDELSGLMVTLTQSEQGYPSPVTHIGKAASIKQETGLTERPPYRKSWDKSLYLQHRRHELRAIMEEHDFTQPDIDGLEIIGQGQPFTSVSAKPFPLSNEEYDYYSTEEKENQDPLQDYPDIVPDIVLGPSLLFCGQPANWVEDSVSHRDKVGISTRITFEALAGEKASSALEVVNNGSAAIWYEWRRLPNISSLAEPRKEPRVQHFYFNTSSGVILPGETMTFPFHFKSPTAGIFGENWEFCTHPVLLAGALIQVSLWGVALYEDKTAAMREALQRELESREAMFIAQKIVQEIMENVRSPERPPSPAARVTEGEMFHLINPQLHYKHQTVQELHQLWREYISPGSHQDTLLEEITDHVMPTIGLLEQTESQAEEEMGHEWNLSVDDLKQASDMILEDQARETFLLHVNKLVGELMTPAQEVPVDLLYQACLQLWRETIDKLVGKSMELRSVLGMPDKDVTVELTEETVEQKPGKGLRDEKRAEGTKDDKRTPVGKEKGGKSGGKDKLEERPSSRKARGKEEKKSMKLLATFQEENKELVSSGESLDFTPPQSRLCQVDPVVQVKYHESLFSEVYEIVISLAENLMDIAEDLKSSTPDDGNLEDSEILQHISLQ